MPTRGAQRSEEEWRGREVGERKKKRENEHVKGFHVDGGSAQPARFISSVKCAGSQLPG